MFETKQEEQAEEFIRQIKSLLARQDNLIYSVESDVRKSNVISASTVSNRIATVNIVVYNRGFPKYVFDNRGWMRLGELNADYDAWTGENVEMEITRTFE